MAHKVKKLSDTYSIRLEDLAAPLVFVSEKEDATPAVVIRRALRFYLENRNPESLENLQSLSDSIDIFRRDFARVGGNLNQLAHYFNVRDEIKEDDLKKCHNELRSEFRELSDLLKSIQKALR